MSHLTEFFDRYRKLASFFITLTRKSCLVQITAKPDYHFVIFIHRDYSHSINTKVLNNGTRTGKRVC